MSAKIKKSAVIAAKESLKELRALAVKADVKIIAVKQEDLYAKLLAVAEDDKPAAKKEKKPADAKLPAAKAKASAKKPEPAKPGRKERVAVSAQDLAKAGELPSKKARVIMLREEGYSIHAIGEAVGMHPTNVSRYIRDAGLSTSTATVPKERRERIKATIASKKPEVKAVKDDAKKDKKAPAETKQPAVPAASAPKKAVKAKASAKKPAAKKK